MLKTQLILERFAPDGQLLEVIKQPSRSWTKNFLSLLYVAHAQIQQVSAFNMPLLNGVDMAIDGQIYSTYYPVKATLRMGAPGGVSPAYSHSGYGSGGSLDQSEERLSIPGHLLGIQIGNGTTVLTPTDYALAARFDHGVRPPDAANATFEAVKAGDTNDWEVYGNNWRGGYVRVRQQHKLYAVSCKIYREGSPGIVTLKIWRLGADFKPVGAALATGTTDGNTLTNVSPGEWREITLGSQVELYPWVLYGWTLEIVGGSSAQNIHLRYGTVDYGCGSYLYTTDAGVTWNVYGLGTTPMFEEKGRSIGQMEYGACEFLPPSFADPNGEFSMRRYFTNRCGSALTVNEVGLFAVGCAYLNSSDTIMTVAPFCIARDLVSPGVVVANTEILRATYVPQITV